MSTKTITTKIETTKHPLEDFFNIAPNSTEIVKVERKAELVEYEKYDNKDKELEEDFQEVYDKAMEGFEVLQDQVNEIDPKYVARVSEVAIQHLNTALNAASKKAELKQTKDKLEIAKTKAATGSLVQNNTLIVDRNVLVRHLREMNNKSIENNSEIVSAEFEEVDDVGDTGDE